MNHFPSQVKMVNLMNLFFYHGKWYKKIYGKMVNISFPSMTLGSSSSETVLAVVAIVAKHYL